MSNRSAFGGGGDGNKTTIGGGKSAPAPSGNNNSGPSRGRNNGTGGRSGGRWAGRSPARGGARGGNGRGSGGRYNGPGYHSRGVETHEQKKYKEEWKREAADSRAVDNDKAPSGEVKKVEAKEKAGIIKNTIIRGGDEHPSFDDDVSIKTARMLLAIPLDKTVTFHKEFQKQASSKDKTLSSHNKLSIMLTVAAHRASEHTGVDVNACHMKWHNKDMEFFTSVANDAEFAGKECQKLGRPNGTL